MHRLGSEKMERYLPQVRRRLVAVAARRELVKYNSIQNEFGGRGYFGQVLDELNRREHRFGRPLLSAIVVRDQPNPIAGEGFFVLARELLPASSARGKRALWEAERDRVWSFDWTR